MPGTARWRPTADLGPGEMRRTTVLLAITLGACAYSIAPFSSIAFEQATSLKVEALAVMSKATDSVSKHKDEIETLRTNLDKAHEFAKNRPKNEYSTAQWAKLKDPDSNLLGGFLKRWEQQTTLSG